VLQPNDSVEVLRGIGPKTASALAELDVHRVVDLLFHLPRRYQDRGSVVRVSDAPSVGRPVLLHGRLTVTSSRYVRRRLHIADGEIRDDTGGLPVRWFNQPWMARRLEGGVDALVFGSIATNKVGRLQLVNPEVEIGPDATDGVTVTPVYPKLGPLSGKRLRAAIGHSLTCLASLDDPLPTNLRRELALPGLAESLESLHVPEPPGDAGARDRLVAALNGGRSPGHLRLAFDELLTMASVVAGYRAQRRDQSARPIVPRGSFEAQASSVFDFELTDAQRRAAEHIVADLAGSTPMARLLQGDVGSGKTAVAKIAILAAVSAGRQAALMAPTELLAEQLHRSVSKSLGSLGARVALLTGRLAAAEAGALRVDLAAGRLDLVVGTHALFQEAVDFSDLGLVVIDEQHRFGVAQRQRLLEKGAAPHLLVMTATPIPRSLALTLYGDLELTVIDELPPGRKPVRTEVRDPSSRDRILRFVRSEVESGGQAYIVCPVIDASSKIEAVSLVEHEAVVRRALGGIEIGVLHGRMATDEREAVADRFRRGDLKVVLATTIIEVGVDVPAASVMVVESADRFGLSQLHQLRGRVGRGGRRSWCVLVTGEAPSENGLRRLQVLERTVDGFEIAEADLRHRGPGEITGQRQWGAESFRFADLMDHEMVRRTRNVARRLAEQGTLEPIRDGLLGYHRVGGVFSIG
jgi:ATP-dependent DNA helicase RecG